MHKPDLDLDCILILIWTLIACKLEFDQSFAQTIRIFVIPGLIETNTQHQNTNPNWFTTLDPFDCLMMMMMMASCESVGINLSGCYRHNHTREAPPMCYRWGGASGIRALHGESALEYERHGEETVGVAAHCRARVWQHSPVSMQFAGHISAG